MFLHLHKLFLLSAFFCSLVCVNGTFTVRRPIRYVTAASAQVPQPPVPAGFYLTPNPTPNQGSNSQRPDLVYPVPSENTDSTSLLPNINQPQRKNGTQAGSGAQHHEHSAQIQKIDVSCSKARMAVQITFDQPFNGIIYAKGNYKNPNCRYVAANSGRRSYQFEMLVGSCGVAFIDDGLTKGGQAYLEGLLEVIFEEGVQEAWDAARKIRCLWEGNIDQTVQVPISVNMLDFPLLKFSGDTASASLEIQTGRGPGAPAARGLIRIGDTLTAVVSVAGDPGFDLLVRNCVATDGTPGNKIILSDDRGCAVKPKLMGGWQKRKTPGNVMAFAYLSAFKFPDLMDLFLECTVSLCKGACAECPPEEFHELHVQNHDNNGNGRVERRIKRSATSATNNHTKINEGIIDESLRLRRVIHIIGPDDLPHFASSVISSGTTAPTCFSLMTVLVAVLLALFIALTTAVLISTMGRFNNSNNNQSHRKV